jgi:hypothetical protein
LKPDLDSLTAFEYECYSIAEEAAGLIEAEETREAIKKANNGGGSNTAEKIGTEPVKNAFSGWEE